MILAIPRLLAKCADHGLTLGGGNLTVASASPASRCADQNRAYSPITARGVPTHSSRSVTRRPSNKTFTPGKSAGVNSW